MVSFDVVSLFTKVPLRDTLNIIEEKFSADITRLFSTCLTTPYFTWKNNFYEQKEGVAMGSPLSPAVANLFMQKLEEQALKTSEFKPKAWFRYVEDTFVV